MAPDTRSNDRLNDMEQQLQLHRTSIDSVNTRLDLQGQAIDDLKGSTAKIDECLKEISAQLSSLVSSNGKKATASSGEGASASTRIPRFGSFHEIQSSPQSYTIPTKQSRVEFPRFDGSDFRGWAYRCRQFFEVDGTPQDQRIRLLSIHLEGHALRWHQTFMRHRSFAEVSWSEYFNSMERKFADVSEENPTIALKKLQQLDGTVIAYEHKFDELLSEVDIPNEVAINLFIGGLRSDVQKCVLNFKPSSLADAMACARMQEATIHALHDNAPAPSLLGRRITQSYSTKPLSDSGGAKTTSSTASPYANLSVHPKTKGFDSFSTSKQTSPNPTVSATASSKGSRQISRKEMDDRRRRGLCYWCSEKYTSSHRCKDSHVFMLIVDDEEDKFEDALDEVAVDEMGTLNAIEGREDTSTLKLLGAIKCHRIIILVDTGSTHNVISASLAKHLQLKPQERTPIKLNVADTRQIYVNKYCPNLSWQMGNSVFSADFLVMKIGGYDMILGTQWLKTIGRFSMDMNLNIFEFMLNGARVELRGVGGKDLEGTAEVTPRELVLATQLFLIHDSSHLQLHMDSGTTSLIEPQQRELRQVLDNYEDVFAEPKGLPPSRKFDHAIPLYVDKPISCRSYRYGPAQKTEIERQVHEMLSHGIIRESSSSFAAPVVLVKKKEGTWRFCVDYRRLNDATIKAKFPIPIIEELLDELNGAQHFSKIDLKAGYR